MTILDRSPRSNWTPRLHCRHEIVTRGGMQGVLDIGAALRAAGFAVRDFAVEVRDGVPYSSVTCTVSVTNAERADFTRRMSALPEVVSVQPC